MLEHSVIFQSVVSRALGETVGGDTAAENDFNSGTLGASVSSPSNGSRVARHPSA
jgi:hypothetical protein